MFCGVSCGSCSVWMWRSVLFVVVWMLSWVCSSVSCRRCWVCVLFLRCCWVGCRLSVVVWMWFMNVMCGSCVFVLLI